MQYIVPINQVFPPPWDWYTGYLQKTLLYLLTIYCFYNCGFFFLFEGYLEAVAFGDLSKLSKFSSMEES